MILVAPSSMSHHAQCSPLEPFRIRFACARLSVAWARLFHALSTDAAVRGRCDSEKDCVAKRMRAWGPLAPTAAWERGSSEVT